MPTSQDHLAKADRHIAEGEACAARQRVLAGELRRNGHHVAACRAEAALDIMTQTLVYMWQYRAIIAAEVDREQRDQL
jgi:hypothetical protein